MAHRYTPTGGWPRHLSHRLVRVLRAIEQLGGLATFHDIHRTTGIEPPRLWRWVHQLVAAGYLDNARETTSDGTSRVCYSFTHRLPFVRSRITGNRTPPLDFCPCPHPPGSPGRIATMTRRHRAGCSLFHPDDFRFTVERVDQIRFLTPESA